MVVRMLLNGESTYDKMGEGAVDVLTNTLKFITWQHPVSIQVKHPEGYPEVLPGSCKEDRHVERQT